MTKEEALKKWCPLVRNLYVEGPKDHALATSYNADRRHNKCVVDHCMIWIAESETSGDCGLKCKDSAVMAQCRCTQ